MIVNEHTNMIYTNFDKYFGKYDGVKPATGQAPIRPPDANPQLRSPIGTPGGKWDYDKVFSLSSKIDSLVNQIEPTDLQDPVKMKEKLSKVREINTDLERLGKAQAQKDGERGGFVNFWCRLGNALIGRGWLTGGERGVELAAEMKAHIEEKQMLIHRAEIQTVFRNLSSFLGPKTEDGVPGPYNLQLDVSGGTVYVSIDEDGNLKLAKKSDPAVPAAVDLAGINKTEADSFKNILKTLKNDVDLNIRYLQKLRVMLNTKADVRTALNLK